jgi:hypothetical protein
MRVIRGLDTSTGPLYVMTDAGRAYAKTLGNPEGPDALVSEWIGTGLARWLGLPTFDVAVVDYPDELSFKLPKGCETQAGPAFIACEVRGRSWGGGEDDLTWVENPEDICGLVVFDTWTRNYDRYAESSGPPRCNFRNVATAFWPSITASAFAWEGRCPPGICSTLTPSGMNDCTVSSLNSEGA